jgi:large subunit ribosomal protein L32
MAVPKQKQSHSRTTLRRSTHKVTPSAHNACPRCQSPKLPHRVCPVCGSYKGKTVVATDSTLR